MSDPNDTAAHPFPAANAPEPPPARSRARRFTRTLAPLTVAALVGGGAGAGVYALADASTGATTTQAVTVSAAPVAATTSDVTAVWQRSRAGVVDITVTGAQQPGAFGAPGGGGQAEGSGFVIDTQGHIVTNAHVVGGADSVTVHLSSGKTVKATVVGRDASSDLAVLHVDLPASQLDPLPLGTSASVDVGESVIAIGSPFGLPGSVTAGIVSAVGRTIQAPNGYSIANTVQTDAAINHGNSGGPLLDADGRVVGVNAQIESESGGNDGVGFAIPVDTVKRVTAAIVAGRTVEHAYLGVSVGNSAQGAGALVDRVQSNTPAAKAGLRQGDLITAFDGSPVASADDLTSAVAAEKPGASVKLRVERNGSTVTLTAKLGTRPS
jgi:putative serine protease PepD